MKMQHFINVRGESLTQYKDSWCEIQVLQKRTYQNSENVHNFLNTWPDFS